MLYVYSFYRYEEEEEELSTLLESMKEFKPLGEGLKYISNRDDIIIEGKEPVITPLHDFIDGYFDGGDVLEIESILLDRNLEIPKERAIELLSDDLRVDGNYQYNQRIWEADDVFMEIEDIIKELAIVVFRMVIDELNYEYTKVKKDGFEWV